MKNCLWTSIPLAWVNNAAFLCSLDVISAAPIKWLYIHAVTFLLSYKPSAPGFSVHLAILINTWEDCDWFDIMHHFVFQIQMEKIFCILYCLSFFVTIDIVFMCYASGNANCTIGFGGFRNRSVCYRSLQIMNRWGKWQYILRLVNGKFSYRHEAWVNIWMKALHVHFGETDIVLS